MEEMEGYILVQWTFTEWRNVSVAMNGKMFKDLHRDKGKKIWSRTGVQNQ